MQTEFAHTLLTRRRQADRQTHDSNEDTRIVFIESVSRREHAVQVMKVPSSCPSSDLLSIHLSRRLVLSLSLSLSLSRVPPNSLPLFFPTRFSTRFSWQPTHSTLFVNGPTPSPSRFTFAPSIISSACEHIGGQGRSTSWTAALRCVALSWSA